MDREARLGVARLNAAKANEAEANPETLDKALENWRHAADAYLDLGWKDVADYCLWRAEAIQKRLEPECAVCGSEIEQDAFEPTNPVCLDCQRDAEDFHALECDQDDVAERNCDS